LAGRKADGFGWFRMTSDDDSDAILIIRIILVRMTSDDFG